MKSKNILSKTAALLFILSAFFIGSSCEPEYCVWCYDSSLHIGRDMEICADNWDDLQWLRQEAEYMGYECETH